jgi:hypothetical protein
VVAVDEHDGAESEAHDEEREGLQAIEVAQVIPPARKKDRLQQREVRREAGLEVGGGYLHISWAVLR